MSTPNLAPLIALSQQTLASVCTASGHTVFGRTYPNGAVQLNCLRCGLTIEFMSAPAGKGESDGRQDGDDTKPGLDA